MPADLKALAFMLLTDVKWNSQQNFMHVRNLYFVKGSYSFWLEQRERVTLESMQ